MERNISCDWKIVWCLCLCLWPPKVQCMIVLYRLLYVIRIRSSVKCFTEEMNLIFENICGYELQHFIPAYLMKCISALWKARVLAWNPLLSCIFMKSMLASSECCSLYPHLFSKMKLIFDYISNLLRFC